MIVPLLMDREQRRFITMGGAVAAGMVYFAAIGVSFMFAEISLMQGFSLLLGHPSRSIVVVLAQLLLAGGIGSFLSRNRPGLQNWCLPILAAGILLAALGKDAWINLFLPLSFPWRIVGASCLVIPLGCFMGMAFPAGISRVARLHPDAVPWMWGINGGASVLGSVLAIFFSMTFGFREVLLLSGCVYLLGFMTFRRM